MMIMSMNIAMYITFLDFCHPIICLGYVYESGDLMDECVIGYSTGLSDWLDGYFTDASKETI